MKSAIKKEEYEKASDLRDQIAAIEAGNLNEEETTEAETPPSDSFQSEPHDD
jgi:excinuclease UvrABC nuclease subunit